MPVLGSLLAMCVMVSVCPAAPLPDSPTPACVDLDGRQLLQSPNKTIPINAEISGLKQVEQPVLLLHRAGSPNPRGTILVFPGGGYVGLATEHEGHRVAEFLNGQGYDTAVLEYSIRKGPSTRDLALDDAKKALRLIRSKGAAWGLETKNLGVLGFSAGGHLAARLIHDAGRNSPDKVMLIYPAYLSEEAGPEGLNSGVTPPEGASTRLFILIGGRDRAEWIAGAKAYAASANSKGLQTEYHELSGAGHGFGWKSTPDKASASWLDLLKSFLDKH